MHKLYSNHQTISMKNFKRGCTFVERKHTHSGKRLRSERSECWRHSSYKFKLLHIYFFFNEGVQTQRSDKCTRKETVRRFRGKSFSPPTQSGVGKSEEARLQLPAANKEIHKDVGKLISIFPNPLY